MQNNHAMASPISCQATTLGSLGSARALVILGSPATSATRISRACPPRIEAIIGSLVSDVKRSDSYLADCLVGHTVRSIERTAAAPTSAPPNGNLRPVIVSIKSSPIISKAMPGLCLARTVLSLDELISKVMWNAVVVVVLSWRSLFRHFVETQDILKCNSIRIRHFSSHRIPRLAAVDATHTRPVPAAHTPIAEVYRVGWAISSPAKLPEGERLGASPASWSVARSESI